MEDDFYTFSKFNKVKNVELKGLFISDKKKFIYFIIYVILFYYIKNWEFHI